MMIRFKFDLLLTLLQFKETVQVNVVEILTAEQVLIGNFEKAGVEVALKGYKAEVVYADREAEQWHSFN